MAEDRKFSHCGLEALCHKFLLIDETLPEASRARVAGERKIGLQTHLAGVVATALRKRGRDLAGVVVRSWKSDALQQYFEEDLSVEREGSLVQKWSGHDSDQDASVTY